MSHTAGLCSYSQDAGADAEGSVMAVSEFSGSTPKAGSILGLGLFSPVLSDSEDRARVGPGMFTAEPAM